MGLKDQIADDVANVFLNTDDFAESVTYDGTAYTGLVNRDPMLYEPSMPGGEGELHWVEVRLSVSDVETPERGKSITIADPPGTGTETYYLDSWEYDEAMWVMRAVDTREHVMHGGNRARRV